MFGTAPGPQVSNNPYLNQQQRYMMMLLGDSMLPSNLQLRPNLGQAEAARARSDVMRSTVNPQVADLTVKFGANGMGNSTFAAARSAALQAEGARMAEVAAQDAMDRAYNRTMAARSSYFNGEGGLASGTTEGALAEEERQRQERERRMERYGQFGQAGLGLLQAGFRPTYNQPYPGGPVAQGPSIFSQFGSGVSQSPLGALGRFGAGVINGMFGSRF